MSGEGWKDFFHSDFARCLRMFEVRVDVVLRGSVGWRSESRTEGGRRETKETVVDRLVQYNLVQYRLVQYHTNTVTWWAGSCGFKLILAGKNSRYWSSF